MTIKMMPLDMSWFLIESKFVPVHGAFLHVFTPPPGAAPGYARRLLRSMKLRAAGAPFNLRPRVKPGAMPYWEEVDVDLSRHVFETQLPAPGNDSQLMAAAAELAGPSLRWDEPLWRVHWIDGLEGGRFAFMLVGHHSQWDGMGVFRLLSEMMSESAQTKTFKAPWQGVSTWLRLTSPEQAKADRPVRPVSTTKTRSKLGGLVGTASGLGKVFIQQGLQALSGKRRMALPLGAPESRPERNGSSARTYGMARFPVASVKAVAQATGTSFNDVMTSVVNAAYERYLDEIDLQVQKPLVALVPMAIKIPGAGNQVSGAVVPLGAPGSAPLARLADINTAMSAAKGDMLTMDATGAKLYAMLYMGVTAIPDLLRVGERLPVTANMLITNPYGLSKKLYLNGSRMDYVVPLMGPTLGTRAMFAIYSYADTSFVAITSLRSVVADMDRLCALIHQSFGELASDAMPQKPKLEVTKVKAKAKAKTTPHASAKVSKAHASAVV